MILEVGSKVLVVNRRMFENDKERFFIGLVDNCENGLAQVTGHTWVKDNFNGAFVRKEDLRTKVVALASPGLIVYLLPSAIQYNQLRFEMTDNGQVWLRDGGPHFKMDLSEMCHSH